MSLYLVYQPLFVAAGCVRPIQTSWVTLLWPSFVQFLRLAIKEHRNSYADVFFVHLMGNEDVVNYDNDDKHDDEDNKDDDGNDDEDDDNNATINCWKQLGRRMRERDEDNDDDDDEDDDNEDVDKAINCWQQLGE